jgi:hypothetical protein
MAPARPWRIAPVQIECLFEQHEMLAPRDEHCGQSFPEIAAVLDADRLDGGQRVDHLCRPDRQTCRAQHAHEMQHVLGHLAPRQLREKSQRRR